MNLMETEHDISSVHFIVHLQYMYIVVYGALSHIN